MFAHITFFTVLVIVTEKLYNVYTFRLPEFVVVKSHQTWTVASLAFL